MTRVLGIDPGDTTGWCLYDADNRSVLDCGTFARHDCGAMIEAVRYRPVQVVLERPKGYGPTRPQVVECAYVAGRIAAEMVREHGAANVHEIVRRDVCAALTDAMHGTMHVKNDATAWAALVALHGEGSDRRPKRRKGKVVDQGGVLGRLRSHERAACAAAVAWLWLRDCGLGRR